MPKLGYKQTPEHRAKLEKPRTKYQRRIRYAREKLRFNTRDLPVTVEIDEKAGSVTVFLWNIFNIASGGWPKRDLKRLKKRLEHQGLKSRRYHPRKKKFTPISAEEKLAEMTEQYKNRFEDKKEIKEEEVIQNV